MKKLLVLTGGGDCPGLNAVIRGVVKAARYEGNWEVYGSMEAFNGILKDPVDIVKLTKKKVGRIHVKGGTILKTTNKGNPFSFPVQGGDGSQTISQHLFEQGLNIIGVPKTIDNDLYATDLTFGFSTAVQTATNSFDRLVTTAESHHRVMIMEVMGRDAGWIALHTAIAGGAEICLIPEIPSKLENILKRIEKRYRKGKGFCNIVISEGAKIEGEAIVHTDKKEVGDEHAKLGGIGNYQRGGTPIAFDRILASSMGVKAFELVEANKFGQMVAFKNHKLVSVPLKEAISKYNVVDKNHYLIDTARKLGISFGD